jgi:hypothetical protein
MNIDVTPRHSVFLCDWPFLLSAFAETKKMPEAGKEIHTTLFGEVLYKIAS